MDTRDTRNSTDPTLRDTSREVGGRNPDDLTADYRGGIAAVPTRDASTAPARDGRSVADLIKDLGVESSTLVRQEIALAKTEVSETIAKSARNAAYIAAGAGVALCGLILLTHGLAWGVVTLLNRMGVTTHHTWLGFLITGLIVAGVGYVVAQKGISTLKRQSLVPQKTVQTLKEDKQWIQDKVS